MIIAHDPPELQPIVARPSGSFVSLTLHSFSTSGSTSVSTNSAYRPDIVSYSSPRWLPCASPLPLPIEIAIIAGTRFCAMRLSSAVKSSLSGPSAPTMNGAAVPGDVLLRHVHRDLARVRARVAGGDDQLGGIVRVRRAERAGLARDAGVDLAVGRLHRELEDLPLRCTSFAANAGARLCVGPMMKFPSASAGGTSPSGSSLASTYPAVCGSRSWGRGCRGRFATGLAGASAAGRGLTIAISPTNTAALRSFVFMGSQRVKGVRATPQI